MIPITTIKELIDALPPRKRRSLLKTGQNVTPITTVQRMDL